MHPLDMSLQASIRGDFATSETLLKDLDPQDARVMFNLGWHECRKGNLRKGMQMMDAGRYLGVYGSPRIPGVLWRDESLEGKVLLLRLEGGFGDQIYQVRFASDFQKRGARVVVSCSGALAPLLSANGHLCVADEGIPYLHYDYWIPGMSASHVLGYEYEDATGKPYLDSPARPLEGNFKVGVKWGGNPKFEQQQNRLFPPRLMVDLHTVPNTTFYSLQKEDYLIPDLPFRDLAREMETWQDTAAIVKGLDLVISSCTSVAHLAGALGVPTWIVVPVLPYYTWALPGDTTPWYASVKLFRQETFGEWEKPFARIRENLTTLKGE